MSHLISVLNEIFCRGKEVYEVVVAADSAIGDFLFGLDPQPLGLSPCLGMPRFTPRHWYGTCLCLRGESSIADFVCCKQFYRIVVGQRIPSGEGRVSRFLSYKSFFGFYGQEILS